MTTPPRAAASVVLLRDGPGGLEVFLVERHGASAVLGGVHVFPGGKLDEDDCAPPALARLGAAPAVLHAALGEPELDEATAAGFFFAACRETFEEAGVLLGCDIDGRPADAARAERAAALVRDGLPFADALARLELSLACADLVPWSRWVTPRVPSMMTKRFDTRFFVIALPQGQQAVHDDRETTASAWLTPREALARYWAGEIGLAPPQIMSLVDLARHAGVAGAMQAARDRRPPLIEPEPFELDGERVLAYPGDERHPLRERALAGPTRLTQRNQRFEPAGGFEGFFT